MGRYFQIDSAVYVPYTLKQSLQRLVFLKVMNGYLSKA